MIRPASAIRLFLSLFALSCGMGGTAAAQELRFDIAGGDDDLRDAVAAATLLSTLGDAADSAPQDYVAAARADYRRVLTALYAQGHYGGTVSITIDGAEAATLAPLAAPAAIGEVVVRVLPGPRFTFGRAEVAPLPPGTELPESFGPGQPARSGAVREAVRAGVTGWREAGHAKAEAGAQQIVAMHPEERLDVAVALEPGPRLTFGGVTVTGNDRVRTDAILRITGLPRGRVFSPDEVARAEARLRRTGAFASVALIEAETPGPDATLPFNLALVEQPPRRLGFGAELSTVEGLGLNAFWLHRNILGGAERLRFGGRVTGLAGETGGVNYGLDVNFGRPGTLGADTELLVDASIERLDEPGYLLDQAEVTVALNRRLRNGVTLQQGAGLLTAREETAFGRRDYTLFTLPFAGELDRRDTPLDAKAGYFLDLEITPFLGIERSGSGVRFYADARTYFSFGANDRVTLAARGQFGSIAGADLLETPADFRFYSGGGGSVRGQPYQSLGVPVTRDLISAEIGGRSFVGGQFEARVGVTQRIGIVGFYDIGYVSPEPLPWDAGDWHAGAGIGARYDTPIGPIRLDLATPASGEAAGERLEVYLGIGQSF